jgi:hypothetical protein
MARLINDIADLKRHIIVAATFDFAKVLPCQTSRTQIILDLLGQEQYDALVIHNFDGNSNEPLDLVKELFESAIANYACLNPAYNQCFNSHKTSENKEASNSD